MISAKPNVIERPRMRCSRCAKVVIYLGIAEAIIFIVLKISLGMACGSRALVAASLYSIQDLISSIVAAIGMRISEKPPDNEHPYGHGKIEYFVVALMSMMLLLGIIALALTALASMFGQAEGEASEGMMALWIAAICCLSCWLLSHAEACAGARLSSPSLKSCSAHMHGDCLASVAVVISVIGVKLGYTKLDHIVAIFEAVHVVYISGRMLGTAINGLMDSVAEPHIISDLIRIAGDIESVEGIRRATATWSGQRLLAQIDVEVSGQISVPQADKVRAGIQRAIKNQVCKRSETLVRILPVSVN